VAIKNEQRKTGNIYGVQKTKTNKTKPQTQNNVLDTMETTTKNINKTFSLPPTNNWRQKRTEHRFMLNS
jgi:hypothetical protein